MTTQPPANWYPDPSQPGQLRYWDGVQWTGHTAPAGAGQSSQGQTGPGPTAQATVGQAAAGPAATAPAATGPAAPPAPRKGLSGGAIAAIVVGTLVIVLVIVGVLAAIAIPVFLNQKDKAADAAAQTDVMMLGMEISTWAAFDGAPPVSVAQEGDLYVVTGADGDYATRGVGDGVELVEYVSDTSTFCVSTRSTQTGNAFHFDAVGGAGDGPCQ